MEQTNMDAGVPAKRPTFLTVLCILTFVGGGISLIMNIMSYFTYSAMAASGGDMLSDLGAQGEQVEAAMSMLGLDPAKMATSALIVAILNVVVLAGALMMWKLKKVGYYIYLVGELVQAVIPVIVIGGLAGGMSVIFMGIIAIVFIILYGLNLKHMS